MSATLTLAVLATTVRLVASHGYAEGAPPGFSGGFREDSCHACHFHEEPNTPPGRVVLEGVPDRYEPGRQYTIAVTLTRDGMKRAGFQLASRFAGAADGADGADGAGAADGADGAGAADGADGAGAADGADGADRPEAGAQAGTLAPAPADAARVTVESQGKVSYAGQQAAGAEVATPGIARWTLLWTAPTRGGRVVFHVAANAADGDESAEGDFVYTTSVESAPPP